MPVRLSELVNDSKTVSVAVGDHVVNIAYRPNAITMPALLRLDTMSTATAAEQVEIMADMLANFIARWDILGDDNQPIPVTTVTLKALPYRLIMLIMDAIRNDTEAETREKKALSATYAAGLPQMEASDKRPNGTASLERQGSFT
jgi:hypothetical protein